MGCADSEGGSMIPIVSIVGKTDSGKTTFIEKLIPALGARGYRVATLKHDIHGFEIDKEGKDTWRHAQAGAEAVIISSPDRYALIRRVERERTIDDLAQLVSDGVDLIVTEGYKAGPMPKVEVYRPEVHPDPLCTPEDNLLAFVSNVNVGGEVPCFGIDDAEGVAALLEERLLKARVPARVELYANGKPVPMTPFVKDFVEATVRGMLSALRGVEEGCSVVLRIERADGSARGEGSAAGH